ncbi:MAG: metallophosphoesterase [Myxococcales bacterium]|nr:metallophosphoesterase [Myxococcales bacterium]
MQWAVMWCAWALLAAAPGAPRVVAIGDVHGDAAAAWRALRLAGLVDAERRWTGGHAVLVQTGDVLDRGDDERALLDGLARLQREAAAAGGRVVLLNGNHELMNVQGDFRYVTPGGFAAFADVPATDAVKRLPRRAQGRAAAFRPGGPYAQQLAERPIVARIGDTVFVHGGVLPQHVGYGIERINAEAAQWLQGEAPEPAWVRSPDSPVWSRDYCRAPSAGDCVLLGRTLAALGAQRLVVGHTVQPKGIRSHCDARVWCIDSGMAKAYGGPTQALSIEGDQVRVLGR